MEVWTMITPIAIIPFIGLAIWAVKLLIDRSLSKFAKDTEKKIENLSIYMDKRFEEIVKEMTQIWDRLEKHAEKLGDLKSDINSIKTFNEILKEALNKVEEKLSKK
ncbi:MAG: hypothetical protein QXG39_10175 [Candidatus Aenigmatarchaeota archaeon]